MPAFADVMEGRFATAVKPYRQMFDMDPGNPMARLFYVWVLVLNGRAGEIGAVLEAFPREVRDTVPLASRVSWRRRSRGSPRKRTSC